MYKSISYTYCCSISPARWLILQKRKVVNKTHNNPDFEELADYFHGRKNKERKDSVTKLILLERKNHQTRFQNVQVDLAQIRSIEKIGLGSRKRKNNALDRHSSDKTTDIGAGGFAVHLTSASENWPLFTHILPEVAFAGHTNSGKSTLVNTVSGLAARKGPAKVSERAGWTDQICFFQLGKRPPVLVLADMPGYGHAVATASELSQWNKMIREYLSNRPILCLCCVLVDCTRGLCIQDKQLITFLVKKNVSWRIVLTKCDLLTSREVAQSIEVISTDLIELLITKPMVGNTKSSESALVEKSAISNISIGDDSEVDNSSYSTKQLYTENDTSGNPLMMEEIDLQQNSISPDIDATSADTDTADLPPLFPVYENEDDVEWATSTNDNLEEDAEEEGSTIESDATSDIDFNNEDETNFDEEHADDSTSISPTEVALKSSSSRKQRQVDMMSIMRGHIIPVSSSTGAGIKQLWQNLAAMARLNTTPPAWDSLLGSGSTNKISVAGRYLQERQELNNLKSLNEGNDEIGVTDVSVKEHYKAYELKRMKQINAGNMNTGANSSLNRRRHRSLSSRQQPKLNVRSYTKEFNFNPK